MNNREREEFIERAAGYAVKDWVQRHICLPSLAIVITIDESDWGKRFPNPDRDLYLDIVSRNTYLAFFKGREPQPLWRKLTGESNYIRAVQYLQNGKHPYRIRPHYDAELVERIEAFRLDRFDSEKSPKRITQ